MADAKQLLHGCGRGDVGASRFACRPKVKGAVLSWRTIARQQVSFIRRSDTEPARKLYLRLDNEVAATDICRVRLRPRHAGRQEKSDFRSQPRGHAAVHLVAGARQPLGDFQVVQLEWARCTSSVHFTKHFQTQSVHCSLTRPELAASPQYVQATNLALHDGPHTDQKRLVMR